MNHYLASFLVFIAGAVAAANLSFLVPTNQNFDASWAKFALACITAIFFSVIGKSND